MKEQFYTAEAIIREGNYLGEAHYKDFGDIFIFSGSAKIKGGYTTFSVSSVPPFLAIMH